MSSNFSKSFVSMVLCGSLFVGPLASAKSHQYDAAFEAQVRTLLFEGNQVSQKKLNAYLARLQQKRQEVVGLTPDGRLANNSILISKYKKSGDVDSSARLQKRLEQSEMNAALSSAIAGLKKIGPRSNYKEVMDAAHNALDIESSVRIEGAPTLFQAIGTIVSATVKSWKIPKVSAAKDEASNLMGRNGEFLSTQDIAALKAKNADLSLYNPGRSTFYQAQSDISRVDVRQAAIGANLDLYKDAQFNFPADNTFYVESVKHSDTKPKVDAFARTADGKKAKFKLKFGAEISADPTASAIMMTLGFPTDVTRYAKNIKLVLGNMPITEFIKDWEVYYKRDNALHSYRVEDLIASTGKTLDGQNFIVFKEGMIEAKPARIERLGPWAYSENGNSSLREVRALGLIQIWLDNTDASDFLNNRLLFKKTEQGLQKFHVISDPGKTLGSIYGSKPELYSSKVVSHQSQSDIVLSHFSLVKNGIKNRITLADAKWAARLIAGLTRSQLVAAVNLGGWPKCVADVYVNKMISRRNDLVTNLGLLGERQANGSTIQLLAVNDSSMKFDDSCADKKALKAEATSDFDFDMGFLISPLTETTRNLILDAARGAFNSMERITIKSDRFQTKKLSPVVEIILDPAREIERNMNPKTAQDQYIVKEYLRVGFRLGASYGPYAVNTRTIAFSLAYPVRSLEEARLQKGFVINALLPRDILTNDMPANYVLMTEHSVEFSAGVNFDHKVAPAPFSFRAGAGEVTLHRSILDYRNMDNVVFYREKSKFDRASLEAFLGVSLLKIPLFRGFNDSDGRASGLGFILSTAQAKQRTGELLKAIVNGDFSNFENLEKNFDLQNRFSSKTRNWNLIFVKSSSEKRLDNIIFDQANQQKSYIQYRSNKTRTLPSLTNTETRKVNVEVYTNPRVADKFQINLSVFGLDANTHDKELDQNYLGFINGLSMTGEPVIPFSPSLSYSKNGSWGDIVMNSDTFYYPGAVQKLAMMSNEQFWSGLAGSMKVSRADLEVLKTKYARLLRMAKAGNGPKTTSSSNAGLLKAAGISRADANVIEASYNFIKSFNKAVKAKTLEEKVKKIAEAMRKTVVLTSKGFFDSRVIGAINHVVGVDNFYSVNTISTPKFTEVNLIEEVPLRGEIGKKQASNQDYLVFAPITPVDLYFIFDSWF